ncbi:hypothetical protein EDC01DRAFT_635245 [Geopyxis carbonaria]|nr:hypothetical protein EDC01DRAFT_635245 [Geopyxis carbonaria]
MSSQNFDIMGYRASRSESVASDRELPIDPQIIGGQQSASANSANNQNGSSSRVQVDDEWTEEDVGLACRTIEALMGGCPPSADIEGLEKIKQIVLGNSSYRQKRKQLYEIEAETHVKLKELHGLMRSHFLRYFVLTPDQITEFMGKVFGERYESENPGKHRIIKTRALNLKDQWKSQSLRRFTEHVETLVGTNRIIRTSTDAEGLREFFTNNWEIEHLNKLFYWAVPSINFELSSGKAKNLLRNIYINLCVEVKLHISDPYSRDFNDRNLKSFWDNMGNFSGWVGLTPAIFAQRKIVSSVGNTPSKKRKPISMDDHPRFQILLDSVYDENDSGSTDVTSPGR